MTIAKTAFVLAAVMAAASTARAEDETKTMPLTVAPSARPAASGSPTVAITWPVEDGAIAIKSVHREDKKERTSWDEDVAADPAKGKVRLDVKNWKVAPGGNGIVLVLDNRRALEIHDLSKPVDLEDFVRGTSDEAFAVGWHFIAAFPVTPDGVSVQTPGSLSLIHFMWGKDDGGRRGPSEYKGKPQMVVNRAAAARLVNGHWMFRDPKRLLVDLLVWYPAGVAPRNDCYSILEANVGSNGDGGNEDVFDKTDKVYETAHVKAPGLYAISNFQAPRFEDGAQLFMKMLQCPLYTDIDTGVSPPDNTYWNGAGIALFKK